MGEDGFSFHTKYFSHDPRIEPYYFLVQSAIIYRDNITIFLLFCLLRFKNLKVRK